MICAPSTRKLDLACGKRKAHGFCGVDIAPDSDADAVWDLRQPWPWPDGTVEEVRCCHFLEHLTGPERIRFLEELWRVLVPGGTALIVTPYAWSWRAVADPTHVFPPVVEQSFLYFNRQWRVDNKLDHYPIRCNFSFEFQLVMNPEVAFPDDAAQAQGTRHYVGVVDDLRTLLVKED